MADGSLKKIEDVQIGDLVKTWNFEEGKFVIRPISNFISYTNIY